ncbi:hypothetical protein FBU59_003025 [Linderina macrospora]|uniref:Uncharacterized protein n=1 Tax=Linderina macrospora TaxID=4868 RepID=A0ACC1J9I9_9FUNG|nr:hypothetical protein FBU59_003025 [Linderina macrospora]
MEKEILRLYQERIDKYDQVFCDVSRDIDQLKVSQQELTRLRWTNSRLTTEVADLRADIADLNRSLITERQTHLNSVAENDRLRIREHELERRLQILTDTANSKVNGGEQRSKEELEAENETLKLTVETMRIQMQEQKSNSSEIIDGLMAEFKAFRETAAKEAAENEGRAEQVEMELERVKGLYRENLRDLVNARKTAVDSKHSVKQESLLLRAEILALQRRLEAEIEKSKFLQSTSVPVRDHESDCDDAKSSPRW